MPSTSNQSLLNNRNLVMESFLRLRETTIPVPVRVPLKVEMLAVFAPSHKVTQVVP